MQRKIRNHCAHPLRPQNQRPAAPLFHHLHLIAASADISKTIQSFKSFTARQLIESITEKKMGWLLHQLGYHKARHKKQSDYQVWQEGFHPQEMAGTEMLRQKIDYIHYNPVRRGYVRRPEGWVYSSAGYPLT
jgi:putative transposase